MEVELDGDTSDVSVIATPANTGWPPARRRVALTLGTIFLAAVCPRWTQIRYLVPDYVAEMRRSINTFGAVAMLILVSPLPLAYVSDRLARHGIGRRSYFLLAGLISMAAWIWLAITVVHARPTPIMLMLSFAEALFAVAVGAILVETGRHVRLTGRLAASVGAVGVAGIVIHEVLETVLAPELPEWTAAAAAMLSLGIAVIALFLRPEDRDSRPAPPPKPLAPSRFRDYLRSRAFWAVVVLGVGDAIALAASSSQSTLQRLQARPAAEHLSPEIQNAAYLGSMLAGLVGAAFYSFASRRWSLRRLLLASVAAATLGTCGALATLTRISPGYQIGVASFALGQTVIASALLDLKLRTDPGGNEALGAIFAIAGAGIAHVIALTVMLKIRPPLFIPIIVGAGSIAVLGTVGTLLAPRTLRGPSTVNIVR